MATGDYRVEQFTASDQLHDQVNLVLGFVQVKKLNDVGVPHLLQNVDLRLDHGLFADALLAVDDFDREWLASAALDCSLDFAECASTKRLFYLVVLVKLGPCQLKSSVAHLRRSLKGVVAVVIRQQFSIGSKSERVRLDLLLF